MRNVVRDRQNVWFTVVTEVISGKATVEQYSAPIKKHFSVSATSGTPDEIDAGIVPTYDRYITSYDRSFAPIEGTRVFVDVVPSLDEEGNLVLLEDGVTPETKPDYALSKILDTQRGKVARYGITKVSTDE